MADLAGLTPDESSFQPIGVSSGNDSTPQAPPQGLTGDESSFQPISTGDTSQPQPSGNGSFQVNGNTYTPGQSVQHSSGAHGEVTGQNPKTGNVEVKWHTPDAKQFKVGSIVNVDGQSATVSGYTNNGKLIVTHHNLLSPNDVKTVSPADVDAPGALTSAAAAALGSVEKTGVGIAHIFGAHPKGLEDTLAADQQTQSANPASGKAGELAGDLVQFLAANGIVKAGTGAIAAIPAAEQYAQAAKIVKVLADHPVLARILHAGINGSLAGGALSGAQSGGDLGAAAKGAALGGAAEVGGEFLPEAVAAGKGLFKKTGDLINRAGEAGADAIKQVPDLPGKLWPDKIDVPTPQAFRDSLQPFHDAQITKINDAITNSLKDEGIQAPVSNDIRDMPGMASDALKKEAGFDYSQVDEAIEKATGSKGKYQAVDKEVDNLKRQLRENSGDKEKAAKIQESLDKQLALQAKNKQVIKDAGLEDVAARATRLTKKASALEDFQEKLLGVARDKGGENIQINPDNFLTQLHNLRLDKTYGADGRLAQALGDHGKQLIQDVRGTSKQIRAAGDAQAELKRKAAEVIRQRKTTRNVGLATAGAVGATGLVGDIIRHTVE